MEWNGTFEIPNSEVRVGGRLVIDTEESTLTTYGALAADSGEPIVSDPWRDRGTDETVPLVWGVSEDGARLSLIGLTSLGGNVSWPGDWTTQQRWICDAAVGAHIIPDERITFSSVSFGLSDLSSWLDTPRPEVQWSGQPHRLDVSMTSEQVAEVRHGDIEFRFDGSFGTTHSFDSIEITYRAHITATPSTEQSWQQMINDIAAPIEVLLWVATGRFSELDDLRVRLDGPQPEYKPLWVSQLQPRHFEAPQRRLAKSEMLFGASDVPGGVESGVVKWLDRWSDLSPAFRPVIARYRAPFSYSNDRFHSAVAALESYSTLKHGERAFTKGERNRRIDAVRQSLDASQPALTEWVVEALERGHYHTLRTRLELLLSEAGSIGETLVGEDRDAFISAVIRARDAYAHSAPMVGGIEGGAALHWTAVGLNWLLRFYALTEIGFSADEANQRVSGNYTFVQEAARLREALQLADE